MKNEHQTLGQATASAVKYAKDHGALAGLTPGHVSPGASQKKPLPIPKDLTGFKDLKWYQTAEGPQWYDAETKSLYPPGEGPGDEEEEP